MSGSWWLGIGLGIGVMGLHAAGRALVHCVSSLASDQGTFLLLEIGGLGVRMFVVLGGVALVLLFVPAHPVPFVGTVAALLILGVVMDTYSVAHRMD